MQYLYIYLWVVFALDWASTVSLQDCLLEENPLIRTIWCNYGDMGFTLTVLATALITHLILLLGKKYSYTWAVVASALPLLTFKLLIALTNLSVIPYSITSWWQY